MNQYGQKTVLIVFLIGVLIFGYQNCAQNSQFTALDKIGIDTQSSEKLTLSDSEAKILAEAPTDLEVKDAVAQSLESSSNQASLKTTGIVSITKMSLVNTAGDQVDLNLSTPSQSGTAKAKIPSWLQISNKGVSLGKICLDSWTSSLVVKVSDLLQKAKICETANSEFNICKEVLQNSQLSITQDGKVVNLSTQAQNKCSAFPNLCDPKHRLFTLLAIRQIQRLSDSIQKNQIPNNLKCAE